MSDAIVAVADVLACGLPSPDLQQLAHLRYHHKYLHCKLNMHCYSHIYTLVIAAQQIVNGSKVIFRGQPSAEYMVTQLGQDEAIIVHIITGVAQVRFTLSAHLT
jgi:hypothetical protein